MSNLVKPYKIAVYDDIPGISGFEEKRLGIIGSDTMTGLNRALEPNLIRNVNGQNKFSFKMYKKYTDPVTGEQVINPFIDWLISERKIKLEYDGKWYDFIIKDINENSSNYLYTYQLEDALVQELSKNGFGVTLDEKLMNNVGTSKQLGQFVMEETDWTVDGEVPVQTVEEPLVYLKLKQNIDAIHLLDQQKDANGNYSTGVTENNETIGEGSTILAFYSSCKNKPHRFQFIYSSKGYNRTEDDGEYTYNIDRKDDRIINEKDCQYYMEFDNPEEDYTNPEDLSNSDEDKLIKQFNLYLPTDYFTIESTPPVTTNKTNDEDTIISTWYRGARYGFSQQAQYVPLLERYCQKFEKNVEIPLEYENTWTTFVSGSEPGNITWQNDILSKSSAYAGIGTTFDLADNEYLYYEGTIKIIDGELDSLSWNGSPFVNEVYIQNLGNGEQWFSDEDKVEFPSSLSKGTNLRIKAKHTKRPGTETRRVRLIPNINDSTLISLEFSNFRMYRCGDYYGYTDSKFVSPTLIKNYITNSVFEGDGGWTATTSPTYSNQTSVTVEPVYCRINNNKHTTIVDDFLAGTYQEPAEGQENPYSSKMKMTFFNNKGFVLNSCIKDNRTEIEEMPSGEKWILDYKIVNEAGGDVSDNFELTLGEYRYNSSLGGGYEEKSVKDIDFIYETPENQPDFFHRKEITVSEINNYSISTFKKDSRIYLKISSGPKDESGRDPNSLPDITQYLFKKDENGNDTTERDLTKPLSTNFYIEKLSLYRKVLNDQNEIIEPDFESDESQSTEEYINSGTIEHKYKYFNEWYVNSDNPNAYTDKEELPTITRTTLSYEEFKPVYNVGAEKVRSISQKESNYFNILQSIAETFEQWLVINIERNNEDGTIRPGGKKISFKNYRGDNNYACFRYGVNLKDIQRTYSSKNIVTKLMIKPNNNENAKDGFCTIQRAGSNPTGENYIYDFQYYQNKGIMDVDEYLNKAYNLADAQGPDGELWDERVTTNESYNLNGYFHRLKKINDTLLPLNEDLIGVRADLLERRAEKEVVDNTIEAAETSIEQVRKDFKQLIGVYPDEIQQDDIKGISIEQITPKYGENWYTYDATPVTETVGENQIYTGVSVKIVAKPSDKKLPFTVNFDPAAEDEIVESNDQKNKYEFIKNHPYGGAYISTESGYQNNSEYKLTYNFYITEDSVDVVNMGCHNAMFASGFSISIKDQKGDIVQKDSKNSSSDRYAFINKLTPLSKYTATIQGVVNNNSESWPYFWIQPNRGLSTGPVRIQLSNINLELINGNPAESTQDRTATVYVKTEITIKDGETSETETSNTEGTTTNNSIEKTYQVEIDLPAGATTNSCVQTVATVDMEDPDVRTYIEEYTLLRQKLNRASEEKTSIDSVIAQKEAELQEKNNRIDTILKYKKALNQLFYQRYSRFIQEGTWISEEYVDDEKYYIDAQSVLYNSCYPQVTYAINVLELSQLPGYEMFKFELGDKTWAIDEDFFGNDGKEEVIITETSEMLEDPSKNTIKVQNFKNQFQDLFQKITATVQQAQYNSGSYAKGSALMNATAEERGQFVIDSINGAAEYLTPGYGHTVTIGNDGITIIDDKTNTNKLRLVGGAILFGETDKVTNEDTWTTGITNKGISADRINAGQINTNIIQIRNGNDSLFNWDSKGISAYSSYKDKAGIDKNKFVRFDKYGIYGIDHAENVNDNWKANSNDEINDKATFALTWEGLKVTNKNNTSLLIGDSAKSTKDSTDLITVKNSSDQTVFSVDENGTLRWSDASSPTRVLYAKTALAKPSSGYDWASAPNSNSTTGDVWHKIKAATDWYATYTYNGGASWTDPIQFVGANTSNIKEWYYATSSSTETPLNPNDDGYVTGNWENNWKDSPQEAGHDAVKKYLWNYEETTLSNNAKIYTDPALISTQPKTVSKIYEFYIVTKSATAPSKPTFSSWDGTTLTYTNTNPAWEVVDTSNATSASTKTAAQSEYLWNFEVICYDDNTYSVGATANIGTGGKGISSVTNWYKRTSTATPKPDKPQDGTDATTSNWSISIPAYSATTGNNFLWTCESTVYSNSTDHIYTDVSLLTREPRTIKEITEYYYCCEGNLPTNMTPTIGSGGNSVTIPDGWSTTISSPGEGQGLWNFEVIEFVTKDDNGENLYQLIAPARVGYTGISAYTLSLDNDVDVVVYNNAGTRISNLPIVNASRYIGNATSTKGVISITPPDVNQWTNSAIPESPVAGQGYYSTNSGTLTIHRLPSDFTEGDFTFVWWAGDAEDPTIYDQSKFSLKKITSTVDYDLVIAQTTFNSSQSGGNFTISVLKKSETGTKTVYGPGEELKLYRNGDKVENATLEDVEKGLASSIEHWAPQAYDQYQNTPITYTLKSYDGNIDWDKEVVEFTQDGAGFKTINTTTPEMKYSEWILLANIGQEYSSNFGDNGNDTNILVGDTVYIPGIVTDRYADNNNNQTITIHGLVTSVTTESFTATITSVVWGGTKGDKGEKGDGGTSPYTISLDDDFISIPCDKDGNFTAFTEEITPTVYSGKDVVTNWVTDEDSATDFYLVLTSSNLTAAWDNSKVKVTNISADRGTFTLTLRKKDESTIYATTTFEAIKQKAGADGADGAPGEYVYSKATPNVIHSKDPEKIRIKTYKRTGSGDATSINFIGKYYLGNSTSGKTLSLTSDNGNYYSDTINQTVVSDAIAAGHKKITIKTYKYGSNYAADSLYDSITVDLLTDGVDGSDGADGTGVYALYHDAGTSVGKPTSKKYKDYATKQSDGWYQGQTENSVYMVSKIAQPDVEESTDWGPVARIVGTLTTNEDILNALSKETAQGVYTYSDDSGVVKIGINAQAIQTGALRVGEAIGDENYVKDDQNGTYKLVDGKFVLIEGNYSGQKYRFDPKINSIFYANMDQRTVYIAGWVAEKDQLSTGASLGQDSCFYLMPGGKGAKIPAFDQNAKTYKMVVGNQFALDDKGNLYCNGGKIGGWAINSTSLTSGDVGLYSADQTSDSAVGNSGLIKTWRLKAGSNFGVTNEGVLYATNANLSGAVTANEGTFGYLKIEKNGLLLNSYVYYNNENSNHNEAPVLGLSKGWAGESYRYYLPGKQNEPVIFWAGGLKVPILTANDSEKEVKANFMINQFGTLYIKSIQLDPTLNNGVTIGTHEITTGTSTIGPLTIGTNNELDANVFLKSPGYTKADNYKLNTILNHMDTRLTNLGFKGPYTIKLLDTEVGKIYKLGTIVYGYLTPQHPELNKNDASYTADCVFYKDGVEQTLPGPVAPAQFIWHTIYYKQGTFGNKSAGASMEISSNDNKLKLTLMQINRVYGDNDTNAGRWTYFCYSTSDTLDQHPD